MSKKFCFLIPLYNEETVVIPLLQSLQKANVNFDDVFFANDGSQDNTVSLLKSHGINLTHIFSLEKNEGKTTVLQKAFKYFNLSNQYDWIVNLDADGAVKDNYTVTLNKILKSAPKDLAAICGHVKSTQRQWNLLTSYRSIEYFLTHFVYKKAQSYINTITVLPGCNSIIRSDIYKKLLNNADKNILTEDMDWTIAIHENKIGKIIFAEDLIIHTQDPDNLKDYIKQITRWFRGLWQVYRKRKMWNIFKPVNAELTFLLSEGIIYSFGFITSIVYTLIYQDIGLGNTFLVMDSSLFLLYCAIATWYQKDKRLFVFFPFFYIVRILNALVFLFTSIEIFVIQRDKWNTLNWNKVKRYKITIKGKTND